MNTKRRVQKRKQSRKQKRRLGGFWPFDKNQEQQQIQQQQEQMRQKSIYLFPSDKISIQSMTSDYKQIGIVHITDSAGINFIRQFGTNLANTFGSKGFDNVIYDELRNKVLTKLMVMIGDNNQKVFNVRLDVESSAINSTIFVHLYGDLCEPISASSSRQMRQPSPISEDLDLAQEVEKRQMMPAAPLAVQNPVIQNPVQNPV
jgi:hypothetical protein